MRTMLTQYEQFNPKDPVEIGIYPYGKPYLLGYQDIHFNVSHSGDWVVAVISDQPVGIDVERIKDTDSTILSIAERFFTGKEYTDILRMQTEKLRLDRFYSIWTMKESYLKYKGTGLTLPLYSFEICSTVVKFVDLYYVEAPPEKRVYCRLLSLEQGYKMSLCSASSSMPSEVHVYNTERFIKRWI